MNTNTPSGNDASTPTMNKKKRLLVTEAQMQLIFEHKLYNLLVEELEQKEKVTAKRMSKEQLITMMADRNHGEDVAIIVPSIPSPQRKKIIQLTQDQLNRIIITTLLNNNAILHGKKDIGELV
jgi:hypothetical protein